MPLRIDAGRFEFCELPDVGRVGEHLQAFQAPDDRSEQCLLLVRAPSDLEIYNAFRELASRWGDHAIAEQLLIEGEVPLTAGLAAPVAPPTLQRLLDADCEMIDVLGIRAGDITVRYVRSGGHAPFRQSYFDEVRVNVREGTKTSAAEIEGVFETLLACLEVVSHTALPPFAEILARAVAKRTRKVDGPPAHRSPMTR